MQRRSGSKENTSGGISGLICRQADERTSGRAASGINKLTANSMLTRYFKANYPGQYITIGVIGLLLWGLGTLHPPAMPLPQGPAPLYTLLYSWLSGVPYLAMVLGFLLVIVQAVWLNYIGLTHDLVPHNTSLTALLFLLFISLLPSYLTLTPITLTIPFLLLVLQALLKAYNQTEPIELVYTAGFFVALASLFFFPTLLFYGFILSTFLVYRTMKWREWVSSLIGLATPYLYLVVVYFLTDHLSSLASIYSGYLGQARAGIPKADLNTWILIGFLGLFTLMGLWSTLRTIGEKTVELRKKGIVLLWMLFWSLLIILLACPGQLYSPALLSICSAVFAANFFLRLRKPFWFELLLWVLILILIANTAFGPYLLW
ncbi:MAG: hypothetical protein JXA23_07770 [Bacteroidales bacterium]|nr:hypothetical protein [Bacteroidales bacterium]